MLKLHEEGYKVHSASLEILRSEEFSDVYEDDADMELYRIVDSFDDMGLLPTTSIIDLEDVEGTCAYPDLMLLPDDATHIMTSSMPGE